MAAKAVKKYSRVCAVEYWQNMTESHIQDQLKRLKAKYDIFDVDKWTKNSDPSMVVDVGAGRLGGVFQFLKIGRSKLIVDIAGESFERMGDVPTGVGIMEADFASIGFPNGSIDLLFVWEVLDHARSLVHFGKGQEELIRILKPGGFLFFNHLFREKQIDCHLLGPSYESVIVGFRHLKLVWETFQAKFDSEWYAIYRK